MVASGKGLVAGGKGPTADGRKGPLGGGSGNLAIIRGRCLMRDALDGITPTPPKQHGAYE